MPAGQFAYYPVANHDETWDLTNGPGGDLRSTVIQGVVEAAEQSTSSQSAEPGCHDRRGCQDRRRLSVSRKLQEIMQNDV